MLRAAPGLVECTLLHAYHNAPRTGSPVTLPCLRSLSLGEDSYPCGIYPLKYLTAPALRALAVSSIASNPEILLSFLARSQAPLHSLRIDLAFTDDRCDAPVLHPPLRPHSRCHAPLAHLAKHRRLHVVPALPCRLRLPAPRSPPPPPESHILPPRSLPAPFSRSICPALRPARTAAVLPIRCG
ncbi:hypothetical protein C8J57DRAFT_1377214 [Mycena rebaudengoi]|nr:hypothetical protein C8J57DRAFT_1377214 [Mycena rebaudengoi]